MTTKKLDAVQIGSELLDSIEQIKDMAEAIQDNLSYYFLDETSARASFAALGESRIKSILQTTLQLKARTQKLFNRFSQLRVEEKRRLNASIEASKRKPRPSAL